VILLAVGIVVVALYRDRPAGEATVVPAAKKNKTADGADPQLLRRVEFWAALACVFIGGMVLQGIQGVAVPHLRDVGLSADFGATVLSCQAVVLVATKFSTGWLFDKRGLRFTSTLCMTAAVLTVLVLLPVTASSVGKVLALSFAAISAVALPIETVMLPIYAQGLFGQKSYHKALGIFVAAKDAGYAAGGPVMNLCYDLTGDYRLAFLGAGVLMAAALVTMEWVIRRTAKQA
jgi:predicted MFS family arabinose efflux permease